ncbi:MarR family transcriptional regulator [Mycolicibacter kumamotonensis]|uniref:MarR family transcriptional regulator n=2 Tax=Mycolicibacter kumamotonensis TaxID=354243 RepID=A0A7K3LHS3_9MYCO|nr:MarR family transcriptional regulator [Mycolicibacter kumamotonensis]
MTKPAHELDSPPWRRVDGTIMATARAIRKVYDLALSDLGLSLPEASLLAFIADTEPQTQTQLATRLGNGKAALGARIDRLEQMDAIQRRPDDSDRRVWLVHLTERGREVVNAVNEIDRHVREQLRKGIGRTEREQLARTLTRLQQNVDVMWKSAATASSRRTND